MPSISAGTIGISPNSGLMVHKWSIDAIQLTIYVRTICISEFFKKVRIIHDSKFYSKLCVDIDYFV